MTRYERICNLLHKIADKMADRLSRVFNSSFLEVLDCDDICQEYRIWIAKNDSLTARYEMLDAMLN